MKLKFAGIFMLIGFFLAACEEKIDLYIEDSGPKIVIQGEINNYQNIQRIFIFRTAGLQDTVMNRPVSGASVQVKDPRGRIYVFTESDPGVYQFRGLQGRSNFRYDLTVNVDGEIYEATSTIPEMVPVDSIGSYTSDFFGQDIRFVTVKFQDPPQSKNYYRYLMSINDGNFFYAGVYNDNFTDGKYVSHDLFIRDQELEAGDKVRIHRQCLDENFYDYWSSISFSNPGAAAPANPVSNISNKALGYFGAYSQLAYQIEIP